MTITTRFFSDGTEYNQPDFAKLMKDSLADGYIYGVGTGCAVVQTSTPSMTVNVGLGRLYIQGFSMDVESSVYSITLSASDATNPRIDRIVARLSATTNKTITLEKLTGTPSASPVAPSLTQGSDTYEISLAQIYVGAGVGIITQTNITDERLRARPITHNVAHAKNGTDALSLDGTQITTGTVSSDRIGRASTSVYGVVKVGSGLSATDGVLKTTTHASSYPMVASTSFSTTGTDYHQHTLITNNTSNLASLFGLTFDTTTTTETKSVTWTTTGGGTKYAYATGYVYTYAKNIFTDVSRLLTTDSHSGSSSYTTATHTMSINKFEILYYTTQQTSENTFYGTISSITAPNVYLVTPSE